MRKICGLLSIWLFAPLLNATPAELTLQIVQFPERRKVELDLATSGRIPGAVLKAKVGFDEGQNRIEFSFDNMKPAVLFAGDVTCYVLWAVNRDGRAENLGELWVRPGKDEDTVKYSTALKNFALLVTAESYALVQKPSKLTIAHNNPSRDRRAPSSPLTFSDFAEAPEHGLKTLANVAYDGKTPLDVLQAEKVFEIANRLEADKYASAILGEAALRLRQARQMARSSRANRGAQEFARKSVAAANDAIQISVRRKQAEELEAEIARRQAELASLENRAVKAESEAERSRAEAQRTEEEARRAVADLALQKSEADAAVRASRFDLERIRLEKEMLGVEKQALEREMTAVQSEKRVIENEKKTLESALIQLRDERAVLETETRRLQQEKADLEVRRQQLTAEKDALQGRLRNALSKVADTRESARGYILNLPDILFDVNKATLKPGAKHIIAKLSGILLIMPALQLRAEGHTDSTGSEDYNLTLSRARASSVLEFLKEEGIDSGRMTADGYGLQRPIADNSTSLGRRKNRRVEIILAEGEIREAQ